MSFPNYLTGGSEQFGPCLPLVGSGQAVYFAAVDSLELHLLVFSVVSFVLPWQSCRTVAGRWVARGPVSTSLRPPNPSLLTTLVSPSAPSAPPRLQAASCWPRWRVRDKAWLRCGFFVAGHHDCG
jgi:hypothetical protein